LGLLKLLSLSIIKTRIAPKEHKGSSLRKRREREREEEGKGKKGREEKEKQRKEGREGK